MKQHQILKPNLSSVGTNPNGATEVDNGPGRKRLQHDADHLSYQQKKRRDHGLSYSPRKGPKKSRKELRNPCPMTCRKKCQTLNSQDKRQEIFQNYWKIGNVQEQWQFINSILTIIGKSRTQTNVINPESKTLK